MAYIALIAGIGLRKPVVLEVGDIREIQVDSGLSGWVVRILDRLFLARCSLLVATAPVLSSITIANGSSLRSQQ